MVGQQTFHSVEAQGRLLAEAKIGLRPCLLQPRSPLWTWLGPDFLAPWACPARPTLSVPVPVESDLTYRGWRRDPVG